MRTYRLDELKPGTPFRLVGPGAEIVAELVECDDCTAKVKVATKPRVIHLEARDGTERTFTARRPQIYYWAPATCVEPISLSASTEEGEIAMKTNEIEIGGTYMAKVTNAVVPVRIDAVNRHGGWDATNLKTNRSVRIKSSRRLRGKAVQRKGATGRAAAMNAKADAIQAAKADERTGDAPRSQLDLDETKKLEAARAKKAAAKPGTNGAAKKKLSILDAAAEVLSRAAAPMNSKQLIEEMAAKDLWKSPGGKTPHATLYSAILREISTKGKDARFKKDGGLFALAKV